MKEGTTPSSKPTAASLRLVRARAAKYLAPLKKRLFFSFVVLMLGAFSFSVYSATTLFTYDDADYRTQQESAIRSVGINQDKTVVDKVLQLQTANSGPIKPDYVPNRDNPFSE